MILPDLIIACERGFVSVAIDKKREGIELSSGGNDVPGDANLRTEPAALYATESLALAAWQSEFSRVAVHGGMLIWIEKPHVETYRITLGDAAGSYRVVRDRYVVRGRVAFEKVQPVNPHDFGFDEIGACAKCGATREEVLDNLKPVECPGVKPTLIEVVAAHLNSQHPQYTAVMSEFTQASQLLSDGVALTSVEHPTGATVAEDREPNPNSIIAVEMDELKPASTPLKIERKANAS